MMYDDFIKAGFREIQGNGSSILEWEDKHTRCFFCGSFDEMVPLIYKYTPDNSVCLLSPASSSYNMFKNFEERGRVFKEKVKSFETGGSDDKI